MRLCKSLLALSLLIACWPARAQACDMCATAYNVKRSTSEEPAGPMIITPTAKTLGKGRAVLGFLFDHQRYNTIPAGDAHALHHQGHDVHGKNHEEVYQVSAGFGVLDDLDLFVVAPYASRSSIEIHSHAALGRGERAHGLGDLRLVGKYRFWRQGADAAAILAVKAPTGETSDRNQSGGKFEPELQPGSGGWDVTPGLAVTRRFAEHATLGSAFQYTYRGEGAQQFKLGDLSRWDLGASYALRPLGEHPNLSFVLELHHQWARRDRNRAGDRVLDSGGTTILLSPGLSADLTEHCSVYGAMPVPVYQNLGGQHEELKYELITGVAWAF